MWMALVHFSKEAIFTHAHRSTARIGTSHARSDATSCSHQKEKEKAQHQKAGILFSLFFVFFRIQGKKEKNLQRERRRKAWQIHRSSQGKGLQRKRTRRPWNWRAFDWNWRAFDDRCHYCKQVGRYKAQWPKHADLTSKTSYERIRAKIPNEKSYVYDLREDSVDTDVCGSCLT